MTQPIQIEGLLNCIEAGPHSCPQNAFESGNSYRLGMPMHFGLHFMEAEVLKNAMQEAVDSSFQLRMFHQPCALNGLLIWWPQLSLKSPALLGTN